MTDAANVDLRVWPSPFNTPVAARTVFVADCTLRDGEQQAGLVFSSDAKVEIARALDDLGVFEIEAGTPAISEDDAIAVARICGLALSAKISVLCRAKESDIDAAAELGVWGVRISYPVSRIQRAAKFGDATDDDYLATALRVSEHAKGRGLAVIFSPFDTTRADMPFLLSICDALASAGTVDRLRVVDTTGCASPDGISYLVSRLRTAVPSLPLEIHCHDDFGLAVANTLAGVHAGADFVSTTMNGLGERAGNAATEEVAVALELLSGHRTGLDLSLLTTVARLVSNLSGMPIPQNKAVVGGGAFRHESGMVVAGVLKDPFTAEPYRPEIVGQTREIVIGKKSGLASLRYKIDQLGMQLPDEVLAQLLQVVKTESIRLRRSLADDELIVLATSVSSTDH